MSMKDLQEEFGPVAEIELIDDVVRVHSGNYYSALIVADEETDMILFLDGTPVTSGELHGMISHLSYKREEV